MQQIRSISAYAHYNRERERRAKTAPYIASLHFYIVMSTMTLSSDVNVFRILPKMNKIGSFLLHHLTKLYVLFILYCMPTVQFILPYVLRIQLFSFLSIAFLKHGVV